MAAKQLPAAVVARCLLAAMWFQPNDIAANNFVDERETEPISWDHRWPMDGARRGRRYPDRRVCAALT